MFDYSGRDPEKLAELQMACAERYRKLAQRRKEESGMKDGGITIKPARESIASCGVCLARNYDTENFPALGKRVDMVFDVSISSGSSGFTFCLCRDCMKRLIGTAATALAAEAAERH